MASVSEHLHVAESELRTLRTIAQKMILSQEEMVRVDLLLVIQLNLFSEFILTILFLDTFISGRGGAQKMLACTLLETMC